MKLWNTVLQTLKKRLSARAYSDWLKPTFEVSQDEKTLKVKVPNDRFRQHLLEHYLPMIQEILQKEGHQGLKLDFITEATQLTLPHIEEAKPPETQRTVTHSNMDGRLTFENFVVGSSSQFAHAAAKAVATNLSKAYNPLFIYGATGLGKTHLLHAIGIHALKQSPALKLIYVSAEQFTNEFIKALRLEKMDLFRERYRTLDLLLLDDIHHLAGKAQTQEEFFHTFNALYGSQKQIVLASDQLPREIPGMRERLHSRFQSGLIADIQPYSVEDKVAILHKKAQLVNVVVPDDVAWFIASRVKSNVRILEGCLKQMIAMQDILGKAISIETAKEVLRPIINTDTRIITPDLIQEIVAQYFQLKVDDLNSKSNKKQIVQPRQVAMYLCKQLTSCSLPEIGKSFGGKHHSTVIHSINKIQDSLQHDPILQNEINTLIETIKTA